MRASKEGLLFFLLQAIVVSSYSQALFTYGNKTVTKAEFLKAYNKNNTEEKPSEKSYADYLELYTRFKIKVQAAKDARLDTLASQRAELQAFRSQVVESFMRDEASVQALVEEAMLRNRKDIRVGHIFIPVNSNATTAQQQQAEERINRIYSSLIKGEDFTKTASEQSQDPAAKKNKGDIGYITAFVLPYNLENIVYALGTGQVSKPYRSKIGYHIFKNMGERKAVGRIKAAQILIALPPGATDAQKQEAAKKADSIYNVVMKGGNFKELAQTLSSDNVTYQTGGEMQEFGVGRYDPAFEEAAFSLTKDEEVSKPVLTDYGYHIIKRLQRIPPAIDTNNKTTEEYVKQMVTQSDRMEAAKKMLLRKVQQQIGFRKMPVDAVYFRSFSDSVLKGAATPAFKPGISLKSPLFAFSKRTYTLNDWKTYLEGMKNFEALRAGKTVNQLYDDFIESAALEFYRQHLEEYNKDFAYQLQEFREGNLLFEIMQRRVWDLAATDSTGLQKYYEAHRNNYWWEASADALLITSNNDSVAEGVKRRLKSDYKSWRQLAEINDGSIQVDSGRFELGQIPVLEKTNFAEGLITAPVKNDVDNSTTFAYIIRIYKDRQPRSFQDARGFVINDYQNFLEEKWVAELKKKYPVKINDAVVKSLPK